MATRQALTRAVCGSVIHTPMPQTAPQPPAETVRAPLFEASPWAASERVIEEPRHAPEPPLQLANEEHVIDELLDGEAIRRTR